MPKLRIYYLFMILLFSFRLLAQDDTEHLLDSARTMILNGQVQGALNLLENLAVDPDNSVLQAKYYYLMGAGKNTLDQPDAEEYLLKSLQFDSSVANKPGVLLSLSAVYGQNGDYERSLNTTIELYQFAKSNQLTKYVGPALMNMANIYSNRGEQRKALNYKLEALKLYDDSKDVRAKTIAFMNVGSSYGNLGMEDSALYYNQKALQLAEEAQNSGFITYITNNIATGQADLGNWINAKKYATRALTLAEQLNMPRIILAANITLARTELHNKQYQPAFERARKSIPIAEEIQSLNQLEQVYLLMHEIDSTRGRFESSLEYFKKSAVVKDSIINLENTKRMTEIQEQFNSERTKQDLVLANSKIAMKESKLEKQSLRIYLLISILVMSLILFAAIYIGYKNKQRKKINQLLQEEHKARLAAVIEAQESVQKRIAKDLHDGIGQSIAALNLRLEKLNTITDDNGIGTQVNASNELLEHIGTEIRSISHVAMPYILEDEGLQTAIDEMVNRLVNHDSLKVTFDHFKLNRYSELIEINVYRIIQELVTNSIKHANATRLGVQLYAQNNQLICSVEDDGIGFDVEHAQNGIGLLNIKSRVDLVNGNMAIESSPGEGTLVNIRIPISND